MTEQEPKGEDQKEERPKLVSREEVINLSRRKYATPRAEVERMIAIQMGYPTPEEQRRELRDRLWHRLQGIGLTERQAKYLLAGYAHDRIKQQLDWLPFRPSTLNPAAFIITAIRRNFDPPKRLYPPQGDKPERPHEHKEANPPIDSPNPEQRPNSQ